MFDKRINGRKQPLLIHISLHYLKCMKESTLFTILLPSTEESEVDYF